MKYYFRLDDASDHMNIASWTRVEKLFDQYSIKPLVGIIPLNQDQVLTQKYQKDSFFWDKVHAWMDKGWTPALHGYEHTMTSKCRGINPVNAKSEFAGVPLKDQKAKIREGIAILKSKSINPSIFFAPGHTYDKNTLTALKEESNIRIICDTIANDIYSEGDFYFIPAQSGRPRKMIFQCSVICLHPNTMSESAFSQLEAFLKKYHHKISSFSRLKPKYRNRSLFERLVQKLYNLYRRAR